MKRFSQLHGIHRGKDRFKQAPNAVLIQNVSDGNLYNPAVNPIEVGSISSSTGVDVGGTTRLRTNGHIKVQSNTTYTFDCNLAKLFIIPYDTNKEVMKSKSSGWKTTPFTWTIPTDCEYIRMSIANTDDSNVTADDFKWLRIKRA